jgi:hypothetical protein
MCHDEHNLHSDKHQPKKETWNIITCLQWENISTTAIVADTVDIFAWHKIWITISNRSNEQSKWRTFVLWQKRVPLNRHECQYLEANRKFPTVKILGIYHGRIVRLANCAFRSTHAYPISRFVESAPHCSFSSDENLPELVEKVLWMFQTQTLEENRVECGRMKGLWFTHQIVIVHVAH